MNFLAIIKPLSSRILLAGVFLFPSFSFAQEADLQRLRAAIEARQAEEEKLRSQAGTLKQEVSDLERKLIESAAQVQEQEEEASKAEEKIFALAEQERKLARATDAERARQSETLSALIRIAREPPTSLVLRYDHPVDAARAAMVMGEALPSLEARARDLGEELAALRAVRGDLTEERDRLEMVLATLEQERADMDLLIREKREARLSALDLADQAREERAVLATNAENVAALLEKLEREAAAARRVQPKSKPDDPAFAALTPNEQMSGVKGNMLLPARGRVVEAFGVIDRTGSHAKGVTVQTRSRAQVVAPHGGEVLFAGPFKGYGQVLIISAGEGYHILLAGLARIDSVTGQVLLSGEPVGQMGSSDQTARLYIEIREQGTPVNPAIWIAMNQGKARG